MKTQIFLFLAAIPFTAAATLAQQAAIAAQPDSQAYTLHSTVREVNLDVVATDVKGRPLHGLTRENFRVFDEGQLQTLRGFNEHNGLIETSSPEFKLPPNTFTNFAPAGNPEASFIILFDSLDTPITYQAPAYVQARDFLKDLAPGTRVAIFDLNERMNLVQGFTTDKLLLLNALKDRRAQPKPSALLEAGNEVLRQQTLNDGMSMLGRYLSGFPGRKNLIWFTVNLPGSLNSRTATISGSSSNAPGTGVLVGADVTGTTIAAPPIQALKLTVGAAAGDQRGPQPPNGVLTTQSAPVTTPEDSFQNLTNLIDDSKSTSDVLTLSKVVVYPVDPRELMGAPPSTEIRFQQAAMDDIAEATGGEAFHNRNGLESILQEIVAKGSVYYTLTYTPTNLQWDGAYRKLKVQIVGQAVRPGAVRPADDSNLRLAYRPGYYAVDHLLLNRAQASGLKVHGTSSSNFHLASEAEAGKADPGILPRESLQASMTMGQLPPTELILNASVKPSISPLKLMKGEALPDGDFMREKFQRKPYREYDILFATDVHRLQLPLSPDGLRHGGVEFLAVVYSDQGEVVNTFRETIALNLRESSYQSLLQNGMGMKHLIAIPIKGNYVVRLGVHDLNSDRVGALEFPLNSINLTMAGIGQGGTQ